MCIVGIYRIDMDLSVCVGGHGIILYVYTRMYVHACHSVSVGFTEHARFWVCHCIRSFATVSYFYVCGGL